jgi:hypothetical protein
MDSLLAEREILERFAELNSPHINYVFEAYWSNGTEDWISSSIITTAAVCRALISQMQLQQAEISEGFIWHTLHHMCSALLTIHNGVKTHSKSTCR